MSSMNFHWLMLHIKRLFRSPAFYAQSGIVILLFFICSSVRIPSADQTKIGIINNGGDNANEVVNDMLSEDSVFSYVIYDDTDKLKEDVLTGEADCGFVFDTRLDNITGSDKMSDSIDYICSVTTSKGEVMKETVFGFLYRHLADDIFRQVATEGTIFSRTDDMLADRLKEKFELIVDGDSVFHVIFKEEKTNTSGITSIFSGVNKADGLPGIIIFAVAVFFAGSKFSFSFQNIQEKLIPAERRLFLFYGILAPVLFTGIVLLLSAAVRDMRSISAVLILKTIIYCIVCTLWAWIFCMLFRGNTEKTKTIYQFSCIAVVIMSTVICPVFMDISMIVPAARTARYLFPLFYYL